MRRLFGRTTFDVHAYAALIAMGLLKKEEISLDFNDKRERVQFFKQLDEALSILLNHKDENSARNIHDHNDNIIHTETDNVSHTESYNMKDVD